jgi:hypothetical protein
MVKANLHIFKEKNMMVVGDMIKHLGMEYTNIQMVHCMKVNGNKTYNMVME